MCFKSSCFLAMALYLNVIAALLSVFSSLFLLFFSLFYVTIYAISSISMQLCVTLVTKLVRLPYAKNDLEINIYHVFTACYIKCLSLCNRCEIVPVHITYRGKQAKSFEAHEERDKIRGGRWGYFCQADCVVRHFTSYVFPWYEHCSLTRMLTENLC
jgi:hypothetical protein